MQLLQNFRQGIRIGRGRSIQVLAASLSGDVVRDCSLLGIRQSNAPVIEEWMRDLLGT